MGYPLHKPRLVPARGREHREPTEDGRQQCMRYWNETRAKLVPDELDAELGPLTLPPTHVTEKQPTAD